LPPPMAHGRPLTTENDARLPAGCCTTGVRASRPTGEAGRSAAAALDGPLPRTWHRSAASPGPSCSTGDGRDARRYRETGDGRREAGKMRKPSGGSSHCEMHPEGSRFLPVSRFPSPASRPFPASRLVATQCRRRIDRRRAARGDPAGHDTHERDEPDDDDVGPRVRRAHAEQESLQEVRHGERAGHA